MKHAGVFSRYQMGTWTGNRHCTFALSVPGKAKGVPRSGRLLRNLSLDREANGLSLEENLQG
jgi:hypothetical protein